MGPNKRRQTESAIRLLWRNYTRTTGIWQTVWMEAVHPEGLQSVQLLTDIDQQQLVVRPRFYKEAGGKLQVSMKDNGKVVASRTVSASSRLLWSFRSRR